MILWLLRAMMSQKQAYGNRRAFLKKKRPKVSALPAMLRYGDPLVFNVGVKRRSSTSQLLDTREKTFRYQEI
jgi:hypothetical protein